MGHPLAVDDWPPRPIRTARLLLRPPEARDREEFLDLGSDDEVNHHLGGGQDRATLDAAMPEVPADRPGQFVMEHEGRFAGWIGLGRRDPDRPDGASGLDLELSYVLPVAAWGRGYATEAATAVLAWADEKLAEPVVVCTQVANTRSLALAASVGPRVRHRGRDGGARLGGREAGGAGGGVHAGGQHPLARAGRAPRLHRGRAVRGVRRPAVVRRTACVHARVTPPAVTTIGHLRRRLPGPPVRGNSVPRARLSGPGAPDSEEKDP